MGDPVGHSNGYNDTTVTNFLATFNLPLSGGNPLATKVGNLLAMFSGDAGTPPALPFVGIASHGPNFKGQVDIAGLFTKLFTSFPDLTLATLVGAPRLYSLDSYTGLQTIGVQATLRGSFQQLWFLKDPNRNDSESHYSKPLSDIIPVPTNPKTAKLPGFVVFSLTGANPSLITQLSIYIDRYRFKSDLEPGADPPQLFLDGVTRHGHSR